MLPGEEMATHSCILAWRIPRTEEPGGSQSMGSQGVGHDGETNNNNKKNKSTDRFTGHSIHRTRSADLLRACGGEAERRDGTSEYSVWEHLSIFTYFPLWPRVNTPHSGAHLSSQTPSASFAAHVTF